MANLGFKGVLGACIAGSLMFSSTMAAAATTVAPVQQADPWAVLTAMSGGAPAAAMCGSAVAAAQAPAGGCVLPVADAPVPPPPAPGPAPVAPVEAAAAGGGISPLILALLAVAAGVGIYLAVANNNDHANSPA